jgi:hypothetical protein
MNTITLLNPFKVYVPSERDVVATVSQLIPKGKLKFIPNTIKKYKDGVNKAIGVILINAKGESTTFPCSKAVSKTIVNALENGETKQDCLAVIAKLEITQYEYQGTVMQTISANVGEGSSEEEYVTEMLVKNVKTYEDLA